MFLFDFASKLKRCNSDLYVDATQRALVEEGVYVVSIKERSSGRIKQYDTTYSPAQAREYLEAQMAGHLDRVVCAIPDEWVPEYTEFNLETGQLKKRGWRTALEVLVNKKLVSKARAKKIFSCSGLGESDYERAPYERKLELARKGTSYEDQRRAQEVIDSEFGDM